MVFVQAAIVQTKQSKLKDKSGEEPSKKKGKSGEEPSKKKGKKRKRKKSTNLIT